MLALHITYFPVALGFGRKPVGRVPLRANQVGERVGGFKANANAESRRRFISRVHLAISSLNGAPFLPCFKAGSAGKAI